LTCSDVLIAFEYLEQIYEHCLKRPREGLARCDLRPKFLFIGDNRHV